MERQLSEQISSHYGKEEAAFAKIAMKISEFCHDQNQLKLTDFLDPYKQKILLTFCNHYASLNCFFYGGFTNAERKRALIIPVSWGHEKSDFKVQSLKITIADKNHSLKHNDFLGALLGQGIKREKVGDIFLQQNECFVVIDSVIADYISKQLNQVGDCSVAVDPINDEDLPSIENDFKVIEGTVSSLRLDSIVKAALHISRSNATNCIKKGLVKLNWGICDQPASTVKMDDIISIRGKGRYKVLNVFPINKKSRVPLQIGKFL